MMDQEVLDENINQPTSERLISHDRMGAKTSVEGRVQKPTS